MIRPNKKPAKAIFWSLIKKLAYRLDDVQSVYEKFGCVHYEQSLINYKWMNKWMNKWMKINNETWFLLEAENQFITKQNNS